MTARTASVRLAIAFVALLFLAPLVSGQAFASCTVEVPHHSVTCLHGWWDNTPPASTGVPIGSTFGAQNYCSSYGTVVAKVNINNESDKEWTLTSSSKRRGRSTWNNVSGIYCCLPESDLCYKQEVEASDNGNIKYYDPTNHSITMKSVSTHEERYKFCQDYPDAIYCDVDPEGDAHTSLNCGNHACKLRDCNWHWNRSSASDTCDLRDMTFDGSNYYSPKCTVTARCTKINGSLARKRSMTEEMWDIDDIENCDGVLKLGC